MWERGEHALLSPPEILFVGSIAETANREIVRNRHLPEDAASPRKQMEAQTRSLFCCGVGDVTSVEAHHSSIWGQSGRHSECGRFAGAVCPEQCQDLAALHLESDIEEDLHIPIAEIDVIELQHWYRSGVSRLATGLLALLLEFEDDKRQIVPDEMAAPDDHGRAHDGCRNRDDQNSCSWPERTVEAGRQDGPSHRSDKEEVEPAYGACHSAETIRSHRGDNGTDHRERGHVQNRHDDAEGRPEHRVRHEILQRHKYSDW